MRLVVHVGWAKCASTSFQRFLVEQNELVYPSAGLHGNEHLAIPLKLKGIDKWTAQWFSTDWVEQEFRNICGQVKSAQGTVVLSSERLMDIDSEQIRALCFAVGVDNPEFVVLRRSKGKWIESIWRHAVFVDDYSGEFDEFSLPWESVDLHHFAERHGGKYKVVEFDIEHEDWMRQLGDFLGVQVVMPIENRGATFECCEVMRLLHRQVGTESFRRFFTSERRADFSAMFSQVGDRAVAEFAVPIAVGGKWS